MGGRPRPGAGKNSPRSGPARDREQARRHQQEVERGLARRRRRRRLKTAALIVAGLLLIVGLELVLHRPTAEEKSLIAAAPAAVKQAGCGPIRTIEPFRSDRDRTHIGGSDAPVMPPLSEYPSRPPVSGPHNPAPLPAGFYRAAPPIDQAIHSLEHAAVIIWFDPTATRSRELARIRRFFAQGNERDHVIVAPYNYPAEGAAGKLPAQTHLALTAWHHVQLCRDPNLAVAYAFVADYRMSLYRFWQYRGDAPERWIGPI